jgi:uncharacterized protein YkwD
VTRRRLLPATILTVLLLASPAASAAAGGPGPLARTALASRLHHQAAVLVHHPRRAQAGRHPRDSRPTRAAARPVAVKPTAVRPTTVKSSAAAARSAEIAAALGSSCANTELTPTAQDLELVREAVLCLINRERAQNGEAPLTINSRLQQAAEVHSREMIEGDYFEHVSPAGETPVDRIRAAGYIPGANVGYVIGENLAWGTLGLSTPQSIVGAWIASPGHLANILEGQYTETGISVVAAVPSSLSGGSQGATYTQEFGVILH